MTLNQAPKFLLKDDNYSALSETRKRRFIERLSYIREISAKRIGDEQGTWSYISSLQIDVWSVVTDGDAENSESVISVERWASYTEPSDAARARALSLVENLHMSFRRTPTDDMGVREWLAKWSEALAQALTIIDRTSNSDEGLLNLVVLNCLLYGALAFFAWLRVVGIRE